MSRPTIAVIGASRDRSKFGNKCVRAYLASGFEVFPINLHASEIEGLRVYRHLADLPASPDRISIYLPPTTTRALLSELAEHPGAEVWFNPGAATADILAAARAAGLEVRDACSIADIGRSPAEFP